MPRLRKRTSRHRQNTGRLLNMGTQMKSVNLHVGELLSPLGARGIEKQLSKLDGVASVAVNPVSGCATVSYDESRISPSAIKEAIQRCGHHCAGGLDPKHLCNGPKPNQDVASSPTKPHGDHHAHGVRPEHRDGHRPPHGGAPAHEFSRPAKDDHAVRAEGRDAMSHEMGHGVGMDISQRSDWYD